MVVDRKVKENRIKLLKEEKIRSQWHTQKHTNDATKTPEETYRNTSLYQNDTKAYSF